MPIINETLEIPDDELELSTSRSGGPGGQNVNKVETRVTLRFSIAGSPTLDDERRQLLLDRLSSRVTRDGILQISSQKHRSQHANREEVVRRFVSIVAAALEPETPRRRTKPTRASKQKRIEEKKKRAETKKLRGRIDE